MKKGFKSLGIYLSLFVLMTCVDAFAASGQEIGGSLTKQVTATDTVKVSEVAFMDEHGEIVSVASLKGKVVFINFWATWCLPCIHEMPSINTLKQSFQEEDDIVFLIVDMDSNMKGAKAFMKRRKLDLPVYVPASDIPSEYLGKAIPTTLILDKHGELIVRIEGARDYASPGIVKAIRDLVE